MEVPPMADILLSSSWCRCLQVERQDVQLQLPLRVPGARQQLCLLPATITQASSTTAAATTKATSAPQR